jgi:hypothetical protein
MVVVTPRRDNWSERCELMDTPVTCTAPTPTVPPAGPAMPSTDCVEKLSVYADCEEEARKYKWIRSEEAGCDLGEAAIRRWVKEHWWGYLRARWVEHLQGRRFWVELDRGDFGLLQREFRDQALLLDRILDRLKEGRENLDIIRWACDWHIPVDPVIRILEALDINSRRLVHRFDPCGAC